MGHEKIKQLNRNGNVMFDMHIVGGQIIGITIPFAQPTGCPRKNFQVENNTFV